MLETLDLEPVYDSAEHNLIKELVIPLLSKSKDYLRGVGYFSSGWLRLAATGLRDLVMNGGRARIICSPIMAKADWEAIERGADHEKESVYEKCICDNIDKLVYDLEHDTLNTLAWMVADGLLDFKFAIARHGWSEGMFHDKVAVFYDNNNQIVAIHGSLNDSLQGSINGEAYSVFKSWNDGQLPYAKSHANRLERMWKNGNSQFQVYDIPDVARRQLINLREVDNRPYPFSPFQKNIKRPELRPYQIDAIQAWFDADCRGVFEMATGTGKTLTALSAATRVKDEHGRIALFILVPYMHLIEQWADECKRYEFKPILCSSAHSNWHATLRSRVQEFKLNMDDTLCVIVVHDTASSERFISITKGIVPQHTMLIADEAHRLGAPKLANAMIENADLRLGLSATPRRWFDDEGTTRIFNYFGQVCFEYPLEKAIGTFLTPYEYHPELITLSESEMDEYEKISSRIAILQAKAERSRDDDRVLKHLLIKRAHVIAAANNKLPSLIHLLKKEIEENTRNNNLPGGILIYCAPGEHIEVLTHVAQLGLRCHEFVHTVTLADRQTVLDQFERGDIQVLIAVKCLDEGVDVPSTRIAFFLASTTNPREFVQRRGRVLRLSEGKSKAIIYDFIVVPRPEHIPLRRDIDAGLLRREMPRFAEFSSAALNEFSARSIVRPIIDQYGMLNLLEERPWDVYHALKKMSAGEVDD